MFLEADLSPGVELGTATKKIYALPTLTHLPHGVHLVKTGDTEYFQEMIENFVLAIGAGVLMVLAVLVLLFARVFQPITICRRCRCRWAAPRSRCCSPTGRSRCRWSSAC